MHGGVFCWLPPSREGIKHPAAVWHRSAALTRLQQALDVGQRLLRLGRPGLAVVLRQGRWQKRDLQLGAPLPLEKLAQS